MELGGGPEKFATAGIYNVGGAIFERGMKDGFLRFAFFLQNFCVRGFLSERYPLRTSLMSIRLKTLILPNVFYPG